MDVVTLDLAIFLVATFAAALVAGLAGFAFGLVAAAVWLHLLTPLQTASLIIAFGLIVQGVAVWKLRHALQWDRLWPFLLGGLLGVPIGVVVLAWANPDHMRAGVGALLILYSVHGLVRPATQPILAGGAPAGCRGRPAQRNSRRRDRSCRHPRHDLVRAARLAEGRPARDVPARRRRDLCDERDCAGTEWCG